MKIIRLKWLITITLVIVTLLGANFVSAYNGQVKDLHLNHGEEDHMVTDHCDNPTKSLNISSAVDGSLDYDSDEYYADKNTCYTLYFKNPTMIDHDVNIDAVDGDAGIEKVHIRVANKTDGPNGDGVAWMNILTPDADTEFEIYCSLLGHADGGMVATLIVGDGNPAFVPIDFGFILLSIFTLTILAIPIRRIKKQ